MLKIGITGGIGSGKTTVCSIFEQLGIAVYNSDIRARVLMQTNQELIAALKTHFGDDIYGEYNMLDTEKMSERVFSDPLQLQQLNVLVHPVVLSDFSKWCLAKAALPYVLMESALIFEANIRPLLDKVITVYTPPTLRMERLLKKTELTESQIRLRMQNQMDDEEKKKLSDFVILNDDKHSLIEQVLSLHNGFLK
jgi:dephospho-CoA kinase